MIARPLAERTADRADRKRPALSFVLLSTGFLAILLRSLALSPLEKAQGGRVQRPKEAGREGHREALQGR